MSEPSASSNYMTSSGKVASVGQFVRADIHHVRGGNNPTIQIRNGRQVVAQCPAVEGDSLSGPHECPEGLYLVVTGDPLEIGVQVYHR